MNRENNAERIVSEAHRIFIRYGIRNINLDEIAAHLHVSKKTIYKFFSNKNALIKNVLETELSNIDYIIKTQQHKGDNAVREILLAKISMKKLFSVLNRCLKDDIKKYCPSGYKKIKSYSSKVIYDLIIDNIERGKLENLYREEIKSDIIARYLIVSLLLVFNNDFLLSRKRKISYVLEEITNHFLFGLVTCTGYEVIKKYKNPENISSHDFA